MKDKTPFDEWWDQDGRFFDPMPDVPLMVKCKALAERAFKAGVYNQKDLLARIASLEADLKEAADDYQSLWDSELGTGLNV